MTICHTHAWEQHEEWEIKNDDFFRTGLAKLSLEELTPFLSLFMAAEAAVIEELLEEAATAATVVVEGAEAALIYMVQPSG